MTQLNVGGYAVVFDAIDAPMILKYKWRISKRKHTNYAITTINGKTVHMHQLILSTSNPLLVHDHDDGNGLNNSRSNLKLVTQQINCVKRKMSSSNKTGHKGISYIASRKKYQATIQIRGKSMNLGRFKNIEDAIEAYNLAVFIHFGEKL